MILEALGAVSAIASAFGGGGDAPAGSNYDGGAAYNGVTSGNPGAATVRILGDLNVGKGSISAPGLSGGAAAINWEVVVPVAGIALLFIALMRKRQ